MRPHTDPTHNADYECPIADYIEAQLGWHDHAACLRALALWHACGLCPADHNDGSDA